MEHIAVAAGLDPLQFRLDNLLVDGDALFFNENAAFAGANPLVDMIAQLRTSSDYDARKIEVANFNTVRKKSHMESVSL